MLGFSKNQTRTAFLTFGCFLAGAIVSPVFVSVYRALVSAPLYDAIEKGDVEQVQNLLDKGANPNDHNWGLKEITPLVTAANKSNLKIMKLLLDSGARVNEKYIGITPLMAVTTPQAAKLLLDRGANPRIRNDQTGLTAWQGMKYGHSKKSDDIAKVIMEYENRAKDSFSPD